MRKLLFAAAAAASLALAGAAGCTSTDKAEATPSDHAKDDVASMTMDQVEQGLAAKQLTAVDCNPDRTRKKMGVLPGAILVADPGDYPASALPADKTAKLVFYCADPG